MAQCIFETRLLGDTFAARIDHKRKIFGIFDKGRQKAPAHQSEMALMPPHGQALERENGYGLCRGDIIAGRKIGLLEIAKKGPAQLG